VEKSQVCCGANMTKCAETGCNEKATHTCRSADGLRIPLCNRHYEERKELGYKPLPFSETLKMRLIWLVKWGIRLMGVLVMIPVGIIFIGFFGYALVQGLPTVYSFGIYLIFFEYTLQGTGADIPLIFGIVILFVGIALTYIGFKKMK